jgi:hypothetical protein
MAHNVPCKNCGWVEGERQHIEAEDDIKENKENYKKKRNKKYSLATCPGYEPKKQKRSLDQYKKSMMKDEKHRRANAR